jgi:hypothetical protein
MRETSATRPCTTGTFRSARSKTTSPLVPRLCMSYAGSASSDVMAVTASMFLRNHWITLSSAASVQPTHAFTGCVKRLREALRADLVTIILHRGDR